MKHTPFFLLVVLFCTVLTGCKKPAEQVKQQTVTEEATERVSGTHAATDIVWENDDLK